MFEVDMRERGDGSVTLDDQCLEAVSSFLDFAYSGEILITDGNVDMLFQLAAFLQVKWKPFFLYIVYTHRTNDVIAGVLTSHYVTVLYGSISLCSGLGSFTGLHWVSDRKPGSFQLSLSVLHRWGLRFGLPPPKFQRLCDSELLWSLKNAGLSQYAGTSVNDPHLGSLNHCSTVNI